MLERLSGLVIIVNTLIPALLLIGLLAALASLRGPTGRMVAAADSLRSVAPAIESSLYRPGLDTIAARMEDARTRARVAGAAVDTMGTIVRSGFAHLNLRVDFPRLPTIAGISLPQLPNIDWRVGDQLARPFRTIRDGLAYLLAIVGDFQRIGEVARAFAADEQVREAARHMGEIRQAAAELGRRLGTILDVVTWIAILALPYALLSYGLWAYRRLGTGWTLLRGGAVI